MKHTIKDGKLFFDASSSILEIKENEYYFTNVGKGKVLNIDFKKSYILFDFSTFGNASMKHISFNEITQIDKLYNG